MADNVVVTAGVGTTVAADEVVDGTLGTVKVQYVKLMDGTLDSTTKISPATSAKQPALGTAGSASADVLTVQGIASGTPQPVSGTFWQATQPVSLATNTPTLAAGSNIVGKVGIDQTTDGTTNKVYVGNIPHVIVDTSPSTAVTNAGTFAVQAAQSGTWTVQPGNTANTTPWLVKDQAWSVSSQTALTTTATVSAAAGTFSGGSFMNLNSAPAYLQFFDTTGAVTLGTTTPTFVQPIPANATAANGSAFVFHIPGGISLANGLKVAATTTATGLTTVSTGLTGYITYK